MTRVQNTGFWWIFFITLFSLPALACNAYSYCFEDIDSVDLSGKNFSFCTLYDWDLSGKNLQDADFTGASLYNADLSDSDLTGANLDFAWLIVK